MPAGEAFSTSERLEIRRALDAAADTCGLTFRLFVGSLPDGRHSASLLLAELGPAADATVLVAVDPGGRALEIVTGTRAAHQLDDRACALGALTMTSAFGAGDLVGGIRSGVLQLAETARQPRTLHTDQP